MPVADNSSGSYLLVPCRVSAANSSPASHSVMTRPDLLLICPAQRGENNFQAKQQPCGFFLSKKKTTKNWDTKSWVWRVSTTRILVKCPTRCNVNPLSLQAEAKKINTERHKGTSAIQCVCLRWYTCYCHDKTEERRSKKTRVCVHVSSYCQREVAFWGGFILDVLNFRIQTEIFGLIYEICFEGFALEMHVLLCMLCMVGGVSYLYTQHGEP